jgi:ribulose-bisphosphate carboxylase small chain
MRVTQGAFSFLPDFTDDQIAAQIRYALDKGWSMSVEYTDDAHPRNSYWEMWGQPYFDLEPEDCEVVLREVRACREAHPEEYIKLIGYDSTLGRQTTALSFIVNRPATETAFTTERADTHDRVIRYRLAPTR